MEEQKQENQKDNKQETTQKKLNTNPGNFSQKSTFLCRFCGGKKCPKEIAEKNPHENALKGVHSDWITDNILATQRLSTRLLKEFDVVEQLQKHGVKAVFNLQEPGEHPFCGDGLDSMSGFTYNPDDIIKGGIYFFNFNWVDMTVTDEKTIMKLMDFMDFIVNKLYGKFLVHCHAGTGRTGLAIASWLIYGEGYTAENAIKQFQQRRKGGLSKAKQRTFLKNFETYVRENKKCFSLEKPMSMEDIIGRQKKVTLQCYSKKTNNIPIILEVTLNDILKRLENKSVTTDQIFKAFTRPNDQNSFTTQWDYYCEGEVIKIKKYYDQGQWRYSEYFDIRVIAQTLLDFFDSLLLESLNKENIKIIYEKIQKNNENLEEILLQKQILEFLSLYEFSVISKIINFLLEIEKIGENDISQQFLKEFLRRLGFSLFLIKDAKRQNCLEKGRFFKNEEFEKNVEENVNNFTELILIWFKQVRHEEEGIDQELLEKSYLKAYNLVEYTQKKHKLEKNKGKVGQDPLPDKLDTLVIGKYKKTSSSRNGSVKDSNLNKTQENNNNISSNNLQQEQEIQIQSKEQNNNVQQEQQQQNNNQNGNQQEEQNLQIQENKNNQQQKEVNNEEQIQENQENNQEQNNQENKEINT